MADLACLFVALIWGSNMAIVKDALTEFSPMSFNGVRLPVASLLLVAVTLVWEGRLGWRPGDLPRLFLFGLLGNTVYQLLFIYGVDLTRAGNAALLLSATTLFVALLSRATGQETLNRQAWLGIVVSVSGVALVVVQPGQVQFQPSSVLGDFLILACSICWAGYTVWGRRLMRHYTSLAFSTLTFGLGSVVFLIISLPALIAQEWAQVSTRAYLELAFSLTFALAVADSLWFYGVKRLGSTRTAIYGNLVPFFGVASAWFWLDEPVTLAQLLGGVFILTGTVLTRKGARLLQ